MQAYKFITQVSEKGIISLPYEPELFNTEVEIIIFPKSKEKGKKEKEKKYTAKDFLRDWTGILKDMSEEELENAKHEYLKEKYK
ncbi:MAG: hypothetical protein FWF53_05300 [Candidatus Azobacteroides sp.]|nr:hypothetical protein [Candidatus Azobacteroides sp.]